MLIINSSCKVCTCTDASGAWSALYRASVSFHFVSMCVCVRLCVRPCVLAYPGQTTAVDEKGTNCSRITEDSTFMRLRRSLSSLICVVSRLTARMHGPRPSAMEKAREREKERKRLRVKMKDSWEFEDSRSLCVQRHCCSLGLVRCYGVRSSRKVLGFFCCCCVRTLCCDFIAVLNSFLDVFFVAVVLRSAAC